MDYSIKKIREHDYIYDPNFILCHRKDFDRQTQKSAMESSELVLYPIFDSMFSDLNKFRRVDKVRYPNARLPEHIEVSYDNNGVSNSTAKNVSEQIQGKNMPLFFARPKVDNIIILRLENNQKDVLPILKESSNCGEEINGVQNKNIQTIYRESSTQTDPFQPKSNINKKHNEVPEIYLLENVFSSHEGDILSVERQRVRRAWSQANMDLTIIAQLEGYDWRFREKEIEKMLILQEESRCKQVLSVVDRELLSRLWMDGSERLSKKLMNIRCNKEKEFAQIERKRNKLKQKKNGKNKEKCSATLNKKAYTLAIDLNYVPSEHDYKPASINLEPEINNKYGLCDKFEKRKERCLTEIKHFLQNLREPLSDNTSDDRFSFLDDSEESILETDEEVEEEIEEIIETAEKSTDIDFYEFMSEKREENIIRADPNYVVSHHKDFDRQARKSAMASSQYTVHPVFSSMFSDLTKYRRLQVVCHPNARLPKHVDICYPRQETVGNISTSQNIEGKNRALFFSAPKIHQPSPAKYEQVRETISIPPGSICVGEERVQNKGIQTLYRESSAQTEPYQPDYYISKKCKDAPPEILAIDNIHSSHEGNILSVQRQRVRRAWLQRAMDFKVLTQLDQYEYKFREKELERMLVMQEEKAGLQILTTVDRQRLSTLWAVGSQRLQKKITQIKHNKERELRKIEAKCVKMNGKRSERSSSSYVKKPIKLAVNLNYLPNIDDFTHQTIDLDPRLKNKFGVCDKFMKKRERHMVEIKKELKKILEPEEEVIEDAMSWEAEDDMPVEVEEVFIPEVEKVDKSVATDFLLFLLDTQCKSVKLENLKEHFAQVKKKVMKYILDSLSKELDHVLEERMLKEMSERTADEDTNQDTGMVKEIIVSNKTSKEQLEMFQEVGQIAQEISSGILNEMFEEVSQKISAEKSKTKSESQSEMYVNQDKISSEDTCESLLADIIMDMILPLVVEEIERRRGSTQGDESIKKDSTGSFSAGSFMESLLAEVLDIAHPAEQQQSNAVVDGEECTELNVSQVMPEVLRIVERTGSDILNEIFSEMARRISSREFRLKHGLDEEQKSVLSNKSEESFIKEIIMHELLPEVIQELRRRKKMSNESSIGLGETIDDNIGHMIQVVGVVQTVASDILNNMIQKTTQATFSRIERKQSSTSTKIKGGFITDIIMDTLMPGVVEEVRRRNRVKCGYIDEDAHISEVVQVIQEAASDVLNVMFMAQPADGTDACTCSEEPIESYIWNLIVTTLPKHIRAEMDPRYYFDFNQDTTESFVWNLIVEALPKQIRDELMSSRDITQMTKVVGLIQKAASQMFTHMFTQVSRQIITGQSLTRTHSNDSFFAEIIMGAIMPEVMKEIERRQRPSFTGTWYEAIQTTSVTTSDIHSQVSAIVEKVASGILDEMLSVAKCQQTFSTTQDSHWNLGTPSGNIGNGSEIQQDVEADELNNAQLQTDDPTGREEEPKVDNMSSNI